MPKKLFSSEYQPPKETRATEKGPYLTPLLKRLLEKKITYIDLETNLPTKDKVKNIILWRYIRKATEGDNNAIEGIIDRTDGKVVQRTESEVKVSGPILIAMPVERQTEYANRLEGIPKG